MELAEDVFRGRKETETMFEELLANEPVETDLSKKIAWTLANVTGEY